MLNSEYQNPIHAIAETLTDPTNAAILDELQQFIHDAPVLTDDQKEKIEKDSGINGLRKSNIAAFEYPVFYVADSYKINPAVASFKRHCEELKIAIRVEYVELELISNLNKGISLDALSKTQDSHAIQTFHTLIGDANTINASDIHIVVLPRKTEIKFRVNGDLKLHKTLTADDGISLCTAIYHSLAGISGTHYREREMQDAQIGSEKLNPNVRDSINGIRVATAPTSDGRFMALRLLYERNINGANLVDLGYASDQIALINDLKRQSTGINLVVGPTGSGKSTTLKMLLTQVNEDAEGRLHILTIEDPPEYPIPGVNQIPVTNATTAEDRKKLFNAAARGTMRLDPDVIMIGEVRDDATAEIALDAAMTGHKVWTTLHANNAISALQRMAQLNVDLSLLAEQTVFRGVLSQRLVQVLCPHCKQSFDEIQKEPVYKEIEKSGVTSRLKKSVPNLKVTYWRNKAGCHACNKTGTIGRSVVAEVFVPSPDVFEYILERKWAKAKSCWIKSGGKTMMMHGIEKIIAGHVDPRSLEEVLGTIYSEEIK